MNHCSAAIVTSSYNRAVKLLKTQRVFIVISHQLFLLGLIKCFLSTSLQCRKLYSQPLMVICSTNNLCCPFKSILLLFVVCKCGTEKEKEWKQDPDQAESAAWSWCIFDVAAEERGQCPSWCATASCTNWNLIRSHLLRSVLMPLFHWPLIIGDQFPLTALAPKTFTQEPNF